MKKFSFIIVILLIASCTKENNLSTVEYPRKFFRNSYAYSDPLAFDVRNEPFDEIAYPSHLNYFRDTFLDFFEGKDERFSMIDSIIFLNETEINMVDIESGIDTIFDYKIENKFLSMTSKTNPRSGFYRYYVLNDSIISFGYLGYLGTYLDPVTNTRKAYDQYQSHSYSIEDFDSISITNAVSDSKQNLEGTLNHNGGSIKVDTILPIFINYNYHLSN